MTFNTLPRLTLDDLPPAPPLRKWENLFGPLQEFCLLACVMTWHEVGQWARDHNITTNKDEWRVLKNRGWKALRRCIPPDYPAGVAIVEPGEVAMCWVFASNKTEEQLKLVQLIEIVRTIIGTKELPKWYLSAK